jgi:hypothetical protein
MVQLPAGQIMKLPVSSDRYLTEFVKSFTNHLQPLFANDSVTEI